MRHDYKKIADKKTVQNEGYHGIVRKSRCGEKKGRKRGEGRKLKTRHVIENSNQRKPRCPPAGKKNKGTNIPPVDHFTDSIPLESGPAVEISIMDVVRKEKKDVVVHNLPSVPALSRGEKRRTSCR